MGSCRHVFLLSGEKPPGALDASKLERICAAIPHNWMCVIGELVADDARFRAAQVPHAWLYDRAYRQPVVLSRPSAQGVVLGPVDEAARLVRGEWPVAVLFRQAGMTADPTETEFPAVVASCARFVGAGYEGELVFVSGWWEHDVLKLREWVCIRMCHPYAFGKSGHCGPHIEIGASAENGGREENLHSVLAVCKEAGLPQIFAESSRPAAENPFVAGLLKVMQAGR